MRTLSRQILVLTLAIVALLISRPLQASAQDSQVTATVTAGTVNLRSGPGLDFNDVGAAKAGDSFPVLGRAHGSNRIWYKIQLPSGGTAWISERVVTITPSPDTVPWLSDNTAKTPLVMDCGAIPPVLFVESYAQVTRQAGLALYKEAGEGKAQIGSVKEKELVKVMDGPFCTRLAKDFYETQWLVQTGAGVQGYMFEGRPDGKGGYTSYAAPSVNGNSQSIEKTDRPAKLTDDDIKTVTAIFQDVQNEKIDEQRATKQLTQIVDNKGKPVLAWIVRRVPIYDGKTTRWESFARYDDQSLMAFDDDAKLDDDPVAISIQILFGEYTNVDQVWESMGCGG